MTIYLIKLKLRHTYIGCTLEPYLQLDLHINALVHVAKSYPKSWVSL